MDDVAVAYVEVMLDPGAGRLEVSFVARGVAREQREPSSDQPQLEILAQKERLGWSNQGNLGLVYLLHPYQLLQVGPCLPPQPRPHGALRSGSRRHLSLRP